MRKQDMAFLRMHLKMLSQLLGLCQQNQRKMQLLTKTRAGSRQTFAKQIWIRYWYHSEFAGQLDDLIFGFCCFSTTCWGKRKKGNYQITKTTHSVETLVREDIPQLQEFAMETGLMGHTYSDCLIRTKNGIIPVISRCGRKSEGYLSVGRLSCYWFSISIAGLSPPKLN